MAYGAKAKAAAKAMPSPSATAVRRASGNARFKRTTPKMAGNNAGRRKAFKRKRKAY